MEIKRVGSQASAKGPSDWFTGTVRNRSTLPGARAGICARCACDLRAGCADSVAHASAWADAHRHGRMRLGSVLERSNRGDPIW
jgi:hypothetical protein